MFEEEEKINEETQNQVALILLQNQRQEKEIPGFNISYIEI